jgi:hypothetical protein
MALVTKLKTIVASDYKSVISSDTTGYGITGYGSNQNPVGLREASASGVDILGGRLIFTAPSGDIYPFDYTAYDCYNSFIVNQEVNTLNIGLGESAVDDPIQDGVWKSEYITFFNNGTSSVIPIYVSSSLNYVTYTAPANYFNFANIGYLYIATTFGVSFDATKLYQVSTPVVQSSNKIYLTEKPTVNGTKDATEYRVGYSAVKYFVSARAIRNCLDEKIAALPNSNCPCKEKQVNKLMNMCMLYDGMMVNAENGNPTKAQYIFDILTNYCSDSDCKCND